MTSRDSPTPALQTPAHLVGTPLEPPSLVPRQARSSALGPTFLPPALHSPPARLLLSAGGHDHAEHRSHQRVPGVPVNAA